MGKKRHARRLGMALTLLAALLVAGCDDDHAQAVAACDDLARAWAERSVACAEVEAGTPLSEQQRQEAIEAASRAFLEDPLQGDCDNIVTIRDEKSLYDECIPALKTFSCDRITSEQGGEENLPSSCHNQIIYDEP